MKKVLLLNASEEALSILSWQNAALKLLAGKVKKPYGHDEFHEIKTIKGIFRLPTVLTLSSYIYIPYRKLTVSKENVLRRDNFECQYCGRSLTHNTVTIDHVKPQSKGGKSIWTNVVAACEPCNSKKGNKDLDVLGMRLKKKPALPSNFVFDLWPDYLDKYKSWSRWLKKEK